jgi:hypothetical protein
MYLGLRDFLESSSVAQFPRRQRLSDVDGGRLWHLNIEILRAAQESLDSRSGNAITHSNKQREKLLRKHSSVRVFIQSGSSSRRTAILLPVARS